MSDHQARIKSILIRGTNWLGDAVMSTPALRRLRASFPAAHVALLVTPRTTELFTAAPFVDEVIPYYRREAGVRAFGAAVRLLRARRFDLALLFQNAFEAALLARLGGVPVRIGFATQGRGPLLTHPLHHTPAHRNRHQIHDYLDIVAAAEQSCGLNAEPVRDTTPVIIAGDPHKKAAAALLHRFGLQASARLIALNTGATNSRAKCWPTVQYAALADQLHERFAAQIILIGAASEREHAAQVIAQMQRQGALNLAGETTMSELIGVLAQSDLLITNDTGPAHVAAALGRPTLTIFGPTNEFETAPLGTQAALLRAENIACARCMHRDCPIDHRCMTQITVAAVMQKIEPWLRNTTTQPELQMGN